MSASLSTAQRLYLMMVATLPPVDVPVPCYLIETSDGKHILVDTGIPRDFRPREGTSGPQHRENVVEQLAKLHLQPSDIDLLVCTHFDFDHAGNHDLFPHAELVVQQAHYTLARSGYARFLSIRAHWDAAALRYRLVEGDTELLPGIDLIETSGHTTGHQSVLVWLPQTGPVLLTIDAVTVQRHFDPERDLGLYDEDLEAVRASTRKLLALAEREPDTLVIFGHDAAQWKTLKKAPDFYD